MANKTTKPRSKSVIPRDSRQSATGGTLQSLTNEERIRILKQLMTTDIPAEGPTDNQIEQSFRREVPRFYEKNCIKGDPPTKFRGSMGWQDMFEELGDSMSELGTDVASGIRSGADKVYEHSRFRSEQNDWLITRGAKNTANFFGDVGHTGGYMASQVPLVAGQMGEQAADFTGNPKESVSSFVTEKEQNRKEMREVLGNGGGGGVATDIHSALMTYVPGVQDMAEGVGNVSLTSPAQTLSREQNPNGMQNAAQFSGGLGAFAGTAAGVGKAPSSIRGAGSRIKQSFGRGGSPKTTGAAASGSAQLPKGKSAKPAVSGQPSPKKTAAAAGARKTGAAAKDASRFWEADDFLSGKVDEAGAAKVAKELQDELDGMKLSADDLQQRGLEDGITSFNNMPEEWLPEYVDIKPAAKPGGRPSRQFNKAMEDVWGTNQSTQSRHAAEAATKMSDGYQSQMGKGVAPDGKAHWSQYGKTADEGIHSLRRLAKTYRLLDVKGGKGNPTARARARVFDTLADWNAKTAGGQ